MCAVRGVLAERGDNPALAATTAQELHKAWGSAGESAVCVCLCECVTFFYATTAQELHKAWGAAGESAVCVCVHVYNPFCGI